jgi:UDP-N-acetylmuramate dehydrogenase
MPASHVMDVESLARELDAAIAGEVRANEPMSGHTTFGLGGPADLFITAVSRSDLQAVLEFCRDHKVPVIPVGDGSNLLVSDTGVRGALVKLGGKFDQLSLHGEEFTAGAGAGISQAIAAAASGGLGGLEVLYGVPGSVGGGVYMNAGTRHGWLSDILLSAEIVDQDGASRSAAPRDLEMSYRHSALQEMDPAPFVVSAVFGLRAEEASTVRERIGALARDRRGTQPLSLRSCGCMFRNPEGDSAGRLIDAAGLKGLRVGGVEVSEKHANFFVHRGDATAVDVYRLAMKVRRLVAEETGVDLKLEVRLLGDWPDE